MAFTLTGTRQPRETGGDLPPLIRTRPVGRILARLYEKRDLIFDAKSLSELLNAAAGVNQFLLTCEERMAFGTNFNRNIFFRRTRFNHFTAGTLDRCLLIIRMDSFFHLFHLFQHFPVCNILNYSIHEAIWQVFFTKFEYFFLSAACQ